MTAPRLVTATRTALALGLGNVARVLDYRLRLKLGVHGTQRLPRANAPSGPFFTVPTATRAIPRPPNAWVNETLAFGWNRGPIGGIPDWHRNVITKAPAPRATAPWWEIPDFDPAIGDVKTVWELSRFDWVMALAQHARAGTPGMLERLNAWLADWCAKNPPYHGPNWKCGQESSIRVMHLAAAALVLDDVEALPATRALVALSLRRIAPTIAYAIGQDNNHGTSEAAALFIGGSWLGADGSAWRDQGRRLLENRVARLFAPDGSFSQYSVTYHRLALDTLNLAELWRRRVGEAPFSEQLRARARAATEWLRAMTDERTGDAPNVGANDGANLLALTDADYRDFRPAVHLAEAVWWERSAFGGDATSRDHAQWLGVATPSASAPPLPAHARFNVGGYVVLRRGSARVMLRYPRFQFRPAHADPLHLDLSIAGVNILRDGGTFSYADAEAMSYFPGIAAHNTAQFDGREPMPRLGRFLWGDWLKSGEIRGPATTDGVTTTSAEYTDTGGATHRREIELLDDRIRVTDALSGRFHRAVVRWRLAPGPWSLSGKVASDGKHTLAFESDAPAQARLSVGWESRYYLQRERIPVLEIEVNRPARVVSEYSWGVSP